MNDSTHHTTEVSSPVPPQFGLQAMFIALTIGSLWLAVFTWYGWHAAMVVVPFMFIAVFLESAICGLNRWYLLGYAIFGMCLGMLWFVGLDLQLVVDQRAAAKSRQSRSNFMYIESALWGYEELHGSFPPIVQLAADGTPQHSWRALVLNGLALEHVADRYDYSEPWDGPNNAKMKLLYAPVFQNPVDPDHRDGITNYLAVVTPDYHSGDRFAVIELPATGIHCLEPRDITLSDLMTRLTRPGLIRIPGAHERGTRLRVLWPNRKVETIHIHDLPQRLAELQTPPQEELK